MDGQFSLARLAREVRRDLAAARERDPSAVGVGSASLLVGWPGIQALLAHRVAHLLHARGVPVLPRAIAYAARALTGIEIHPPRRSVPGCSSTTARAW